MKNNINSLLSLLLLGIFGIACGEVNMPSKSTASDVKLFPSEEACNYPSRSSIPKFRELGGGEWRHLVVGGTDLGYDCGAAEKQVYLVSQGTDAFVEYGVVGTEKGAKSVGLDYNIYTTIANEAALRKEFVILLDEVTRQALKEPLPDLAKTKILDLNTFSKLGVRNQEVLSIGQGRLELSRNSNGSSIIVKIRFCPDKNVKCE